MSAAENEIPRRQAVGPNYRDAARRVHPRRYLGSLLTLWLFPVAAALSGVLLFAPRFGVHAPSLVDDWFAITYEPTAVREILHGHYNSPLVDYGGRYRPAYAVMSYVQWTVLGGTSSTLLPTLFGLLRLLFFMAVVGALTFVVLRDQTTRTKSVVLSAAVPALVIWTPGITTNFLRFGVSEPTAFALIALALLTMTPGVRSLAFERTSRGRLRPVLAVGAGYLMYLFGVYMWEASVAVIVVLPAVYFWLSRDPRRNKAQPAKWYIILPLAVLLLAPLVHIVVELLIHGNVAADSAGTGARSTVAVLVRAVLPTVVGAFTQPGGLLFVLLPLYVIPSCIGRARRGDRTAVVCLSALAAGFLTAYISYVGAKTVNRYYIPWIVAVAIAGAWSLRDESPDRKPLALGAAILAALSLAIWHPIGELRHWNQFDEAGSEAIAIAGDAYATGCPVYLAGFPGERAVGLARLIPGAERDRSSGCNDGSDRAFAVVWPGTINPRGGCVSAWRPARRSRWITLLSCRDFHQSSKVPTQDEAFNTPVHLVRLTRPARFVPASTLNRFTLYGSSS